MTRNGRYRRLGGCCEAGQDLCTPEALHPFSHEANAVCSRSESVGLKRVADYWHSVIQINDYQKHRFVETVIGSMFNTVSGKKIALLGFAFKKVPLLRICASQSALCHHSASVRPASAAHQSIHMCMHARDCTLGPL